MDKLSYRRHRFPRIVIQQAVWLYFRFALSYRDVEDMLAARGIDVSYETVRRWALKFGTIIARKLRRGRPPFWGRAQAARRRPCAWQHNFSRRGAYQPSPTCWKGAY